ncbi:MAG: DUF6445 family protein [Sphingomicrobium sp.]
MKPELRRLGASQTPVVVIEDFSGEPEALVEIAAAMAPFPYVGGGYYPGLRRIFTEADQAASEYVDRTLEAAAQFIAGAFDVDGFNLLEASFSMITTDPAELQPPQRAPHFDTTDPKYYAVLHYLNVAPGTGTAFFRQRSTGIERVTEENVDIFVRVAKREMATLPTDSGYILGSDPHYEQIGAVEAVPDRLIIYQGSLLHSGIIPPGMNRSSNPREGRLTANIFVRGH